MQIGIPTEINQLEPSFSDFMALLVFPKTKGTHSHPFEVIVIDQCQLPLSKLLSYSLEHD